MRAPPVARAATPAPPRGPPSASRRRARAAARRPRPPAARATESWRRIASCSRRSSGPGSTPIASTSAAPGLPVGLERVGLPPGAIQRQHPLRVQPLAQRLGDDEALELGRPHRGGGRRPGRARSRARAPRVATPRAGGSPRPRTARRRCRRAVAPRHSASASRGAPRATSRSNRVRVDGIGRDPQLVPAPARDDRGAVPARGQRLAQLGHVDLHQLRRRRRRLLPPETLDQALARDRRARVEGEHRQQCPRLGAAERRPPARRRSPPAVPRTWTSISSAPMATLRRVRDACKRRPLPAFTGPCHRGSTARAQAASRQVRTAQETTMHTSIQLVPTSARSAGRGARRPRECPAFRLSAGPRAAAATRARRARHVRRTGERLQRTTAPGSALNHHPPIRGPPS